QCFFIYNAGRLCPVTVLREFALLYNVYNVFSCITLLLALGVLAFELSPL
uniref:Uncharacterized protein n=1 Tax=Ciona intestinalis TaxID=7719 RepID=H2XLK1_CIOIN